jgi:ABC-type dipeptide/oligopeptide/nickel transport system ATPase component
MAVSCAPRLLIADEPTTALDVTIQAQYLELLKELQAATGVAIILVTHDFGIVAANADRVAVMYAGKIVEMGSTLQVFNAPAHPYTQALLRCLPDVGLQRQPLHPYPRALLSAALPLHPSAGRQRIVLAGEVPNPMSPPSGCASIPAVPRPCRTARRRNRHGERSPRDASRPVICIERDSSLDILRPGPGDR